MKRILAIVNQPSISKDFIRYGMQMSAAQRAWIHFLYVQNPDAYPLGTPDTMGAAVAELHKSMQILSQEAEKNLVAYIDEISKEVEEDVHVSHSTDIGDLVGIIERLDSENKVDEVLLESSVEEGVFFENVGNMDVIRNINLPVWVVPDGAVYKPFTEIIYATDYKEEDVFTLRNLINNTREYSPKITALHVTDSVDFEEKTHREGFREMIEKNTGYEKVSVEAVPIEKGQNLAQTIKKFSDKVKANLVVVLKENRNFLERMFKSGTAKNIIKEAKTPVLVFHVHEVGG